MSKSKSTVIVDLDGTLLTKRWPELGEWQPGAIEAMFALHEAGIHLKLHSARLSPYDPFSMRQREPHLVAAAIQEVRALLDEAGLTFIDIWTLPGKPGGKVYIDDRAERYAGRPGSWKAMVQKVLLRCGEPAPDIDHLPTFDQGIAKEADE